MRAHKMIYNSKLAVQVLEEEAKKQGISATDLIVNELSKIFTTDELIKQLDESAKLLKEEAK